MCLQVHRFRFHSILIHVFIIIIIIIIIIINIALITILTTNIKIYWSHAQNIMLMMMVMMMIIITYFCDENHESTKIHKIITTTIIIIIIIMMNATVRDLKGQASHIVRLLSFRFACARTISAPHIDLLKGCVNWLYLQNH